MNVHVSYTIYFSNIFVLKGQMIFKRKKNNIIYRLNISSKCHGVIFNISRIMWHLEFNVKSVFHTIYIYMY